MFKKNILCDNTILLVSSTIFELSKIYDDVQKLEKNKK